MALLLIRVRGVTERPERCVNEKGAALRNPEYSDEVREDAAVEELVTKDST